MTRILSTKEDNAEFSNVHFVTGTEELTFRYTWGIDDMTYVFSNDVLISDYIEIKKSGPKVPGCMIAYLIC